MNKKIVALGLLLLLTINASAQVIKFKATHESHYRFDPATEAITSTLFKDRISAKTFVFDLNAGALRITAKEHNENIKLTPPQQNAKGDLVGVGTELNSAQMVSVVITKGMLAVIYPEQELMVVYNTQMSE